MARAANGRQLARREGQPAIEPARRAQIRIERPANDNLPSWAMRTGRLVVAAVLFAIVALAGFFLLA